MRIKSPDPKPRDSGDYRVEVTKGYGDPTADIYLDEQGELRLQWVHVDDCDRLIRAAADAKEQILRFRAEAEAPHGRRHVYQGTCQLCGKPEDDELHAEAEPQPPAPASADSGRDCDQANPESGAWCHRSGEHDGHRDTDGETWTTAAPPAGDSAWALTPAGQARAEAEAPRLVQAVPAECDARPYPAGSEGDDGTRCGLPAGHAGPHDDTPAGSGAPEWCPATTHMEHDDVTLYCDRPRGHRGSHHAPGPDEGSEVAWGGQADGCLTEIAGVPVAEVFGSVAS